MTALLRGGSSRVAAGILASRVAGMAREVALAAFLGNGAAVEAFTVAFRIPNVLQNLLGEGVLSASFIPAYSKLLAEGRDEEAGRLASAVLTMLMALTGALVIIGVLFAEGLTDALAPGLSGDRRDLTVSLIRIVTPGIGLLVASAWCLGVLNSHRRFFLSYVAPVVWNVVQIVVLVGAGTLIYQDATLPDATGLTPDARGLALALGWATLIGAVAQLGVQLPSVLSLRGDLRVNLKIDDHVRGVLSRFGPVVGARGVVQLSAFLDTLLASFLAVGAIAALRYGQVLYLLPISLFGMSIAAAELPELSAATADGLQAARVAIARRLRTGLARIAFFVVPTAAVFVFAGDIVIGALLQRGAFTRQDTIQAWAVLAGYSVGLLGATSARLLQSASYGLGDAKTPAMASIRRVMVSIAIGVVLMLQLDRIGVGPDGLMILGDLPAFRPLPAVLREGTDVPRLGAVGLTLGSGVAAWVEYALLRNRLAQVVGPIRLGGGVIEPTVAAAMAAIATTAIARLSLGALGPLSTGLIALPAAGAVYLVVVKQLGFSFARAVAGRPPAPQATIRQRPPRPPRPPKPPGATGTSGPTGARRPPSGPRPPGR